MDSARATHLPPRHGATMFADQKHFDEFVLKHSKDRCKRDFLSFENTIVIRKQNCINVCLKRRV